MNYRRSFCRYLMVSAIMIFLVHTSFGQTFVPFTELSSYSDPMPENLRSIELTKSEALSEIAFNQGQSSFSKAYFSTESINELLNRDPSVVGIRFYNGLESRGSDMGTVIAVPVLSDMTEVKEGGYLESTGFSGAGNSTIRQIDNTTARNRVSNIINSGSFVSFSSFFSKTDLLNMLSSGESTGINLYPSDQVFAMNEPPTDLQTKLTFMASGGNQQSNESGMMPEGGYMLSAAPCPPYCGRGNDYLNSGWSD